MTSSLVGSEMCIRDRGKSFYPFSLMLAPFPHLEQGSLGHPFGALALTAVSYTHLTLPTICSV
eukprot:4062023-Prorocentrum_lima.AAC.1